MGQDIDYTLGVPVEPPEGMISFLLEKGFLKSEFLIYRVAYEQDPIAGKKTKVVACACTACLAKFHAPYVEAGGCGRVYSPALFGFYNEDTMESVISGMTTSCPYCGTPVKAMHVGGFKKTVEEDYVYPITVWRRGDIPYLLSYQVHKSIDKDGNTRFITLPHEGYAFDGKKCVKLVGYEKYFSQVTFHGSWEQKKECTDTYGAPEAVFPFSMDILRGTVLENSKPDVFLKDTKSPYIITYLRLYQKHANVENLVVQGASSLLNKKIHAASMRSYYTPFTGSTNIKGIRWKEKRPSAMLGLNKSEFKRCIAEKWDNEHLDFYLQMKERGILLTDGEYKDCKKFGLWMFRDLMNREIPNGYSVMRCVRYVIKQAQPLVTLIDYWDMSRRLGDELCTEDDIFPQNLKAAHDALVERINAEKTALRKKEFKKRFEELQRFTFTEGGLCILPPRSEAELRKEGKTLHHCVETYADRHARGDTAILFIRHTDAPKEPYFTLELDEKTLSVRQNRGLRNCDRTEEVVVFEQKWLEFMKGKKLCKKS